MDRRNFNVSKKDNVDLTELRNTNGTIATITNFGARLVDWVYDDVNLVIGYANYEQYLNTTEYYYGATIGRFANRIANGKFSLNGKEYSLHINNPPNHLHGGEMGFHNCIWNVEHQSTSEVVLMYYSKDGEENYPGNLTVQLTYRLTEKDELEITYNATTDADTIVNLTHHSFFNLNGAGSGTILNHLLQLNAGRYTPIDENLIPTGEIADVVNTPLDFLQPHRIGERINEDYEQLRFGVGYDHNYVLDGTQPAAVVTGDQTQITMEVFTDQPGMQFYSGNFMKGATTIKGGYADDYRTAFCLETQHFPDAPNQPAFPTTVLKAGAAFKSKTTYRLSRAK